MEFVAALRLLIFLILASTLWALTPIFPLKDIRPGQHGIGKTVFSGDRVEEFQVEILGVLENMGPKQSVILSRLSGGPLAQTGVMQGMSGSPVYIDGKLVGAVALAFSFSKEPIAGIRPIEDMLPLGAPAPPQQVALAGKPATRDFGGTELIDIATPLSFNGFTEAAIRQFAPQMHKLGLEPRQGVSSGGHLPPTMGAPGQLHPGSMITVQLLSGDLSVGADGTVTAIDGNRIFAFGHRFLSVGGTELPFARASVITNLANLQASFKISSAREWMGTITEDRSTSIYGLLGHRAATVPLSITVHGALHATPFTYNMQMVNDRVLSPLILQMATFSVIDATERTLGMGSFTLTGQIDFQRGAPLKIENVYAGDFGVAQTASLGLASPLSYIMGAGFDALKVKDIKLTIDSSERRHVFQVDQIAMSKRDLHPGDTAELVVTLTGENGAEMVRAAQYRIPVGAPAGTLQFTVADATSTNLTEFQQTLTVPPKSPEQVVSFLGGLHPNNKVYVRVSRTDASFQVQGTDLPDPPPSVALLLAKSQATPQNTWLGRGSTVDLIQIDAGDAVVTGSKTAQVEIKE